MMKPNASRRVHRLFYLLLIISAEFVFSENEVERKSILQSHETRCSDLWLGPRSSNAGSVCVKLDNKDTQNPQLRLSLAAEENMHIEESYIWIGKEMDHMPQISAADDNTPRDNRHPLFSEFPYINKTIGGDNVFNTSIPLLDYVSSCKKWAEPISLFLAIHPVVVRNGGYRKNSKPQPPTISESKASSYLRAKGNTSVPNEFQRGLGWMELELAFTCGNDKTQLSPPQELAKVEYRRHLFHAIRPRDLAEECGNDYSRFSLPDYSNELTADFLFRFHVSSVLSADVAYDFNLVNKIDYYRNDGIYERFDAFDDGFDDAAIVAKVDNVCYGIFRGTVEFNGFDELQNLLPGYRKVPGTDCYVRTGFYNGYFTNYRAEFEQAVRECVDSCVSGDCELILSGGSQGASIAVVASLYLFEEYNPTVMSIAPLRTFLPTSPFDHNEVCTHINPQKQYHFVLTDDFLKAYDPVPYIYGFGTKNMGQEILFDGNGNFNYQGVAKSYIPRREPSSIAIHTRWNYFVKSKKAYDNVCLPEPTYGWVDGHWCTGDDNCMVTSSCIEGYCATKVEIGLSCTQDNVCLSGTCADGICAGGSNAPTERSSAGEACRRDQDCSTGRCEGFWGFSHCQPQLEPGKDCNEHSDCLSGYCTSFIDGKCL